MKLQAFFRSCMLVGGLFFLLSAQDAHANIFDTLKNTFRNRSFIQAVNKGNVAKAQDKLEAGADVNTKSKNKSALMISIENNNGEMFNLILNFGPDLNVQDLAGESAVYKAIKIRNTDMASALIAKGANTALRTYSGDSPLSLATRLGMGSIIELLKSDVSSATSESCLFIKQSKNAPDRSVNLVFVPSGFGGDMNLFKKEAQKIWKIFSNYTPFNPDIDLINVAFAMVEDESNNFCHFNCAGIERLLCCTDSVAKKLSKACTTENRQTVVIHNSTQYGGAGSFSSNVSTTSISPAAPKVAVHELGHSLFLLADEYTYGDGTPQSNRNCSTEGCGRWKDLIEGGMASCQSNGCKGGKYFTDGETIMKTLTKDFEKVNERIACCAYKNATGEYPNFCRVFLTVGGGLDKYCGLRGSEESKRLNKQLVLVPVEMEFVKNKSGRWQLLSKIVAQGPGNYAQEMVQGKAQGDFSIDIETANGLKKIRLDNEVAVEYMPAEDVEAHEEARIIKMPRTVIKIVVDGMGAQKLVSNQKGLEDVVSVDFKIKINGQSVLY